MPILFASLCIKTYTSVTNCRSVQMKRAKSDFINRACTCLVRNAAGESQLCICNRQLDWSMFYTFFLSLFLSGWKALCSVASQSFRWEIVWLLVSVISSSIRNTVECIPKSLLSPKPGSKLHLSTWNTHTHTSFSLHLKLGHSGQNIMQAADIFLSFYINALHRLGTTNQVYIKKSDPFRFSCGWEKETEKERAYTRKMLVLPLSKFHH